MWDGRHPGRVGRGEREGVGWMFPGPPMHQSMAVHPLTLGGWGGRAGNTLVWRGGRSMPAGGGRRSMLAGGGGRSTPVIGGRSTSSGARRATTANKESPLGLAPSGVVLPVFAKAHHSGNVSLLTYHNPS